MTSTSQLAPFTHAQVHRILAPSILAANAQCNGGATGTRCGIKWYLNDTSHVLAEDEMGVGQQMSALEITISALVALDVPGKTGGTGGGSGIKPPVCPPFLYSPLSLFLSMYKICKYCTNSYR